MTYNVIIKKEKRFRITCTFSEESKWGVISILVNSEKIGRISLKEFQEAIENNLDDLIISVDGCYYENIEYSKENGELLILISVSRDKYSFMPTKKLNDLYEFFDVLTENLNNKWPEVYINF